MQREMLHKLLFAPIVLHALFVFSAAWGWWRTWSWSGRWVPDGLDAAVFAVLLGHLLLGIAAFRAQRYVGQYLLATYATVAGFVLIEVTLSGLAASAARTKPNQPLEFRVDSPEFLTGSPGTLEVTVNSLGLRGPETDLDEIDVRILCVGGSTTQCFYVTDRDTWPWRFHDELNRRLERRVFVGNAGRAGDMAAEHERLLTRFAHTPRFEWVVLLCGINDLQAHLGGSYAQRRKDAWSQAGRQAGIDVLDPEVRRRVATAKSERESPVETRPRGAWYRSSATRRFCRRIVRDLGRKVVIRDPDANWFLEARADRLRTLASETLHEPPDDFPEMLDQYRADLVTLIATCRSLGLKPVLATQPHRFHLADDPEVEATFYITHSFHAAYSPEAYGWMLDEFNAAMRDVCRAEKVVCLDLAALLCDDASSMYDECHFTSAGCERVAGEFVRYFMAKLRPNRDRPAR